MVVVVLSAAGVLVVEVRYMVSGAGVSLQAYKGMYVRTKESPTWYRYGGSMIVGRRFSN